MQFFVWLIRLAAAACLALLFGEWRHCWDSPNSRTGYFLLLVAVAVYLWLVVFPKKWQEEAIGSAIGLVAGAYVIYLAKLAIVLVLVKPVPLFRCANLFLLVTATLAWITNGRTINPLRVVRAALIPFGLWTFCFLVLPSLV